MYVAGMGGRLLCQFRRGQQLTVGSSHHPAAPLHADELVWGGCWRPWTCYWDPWVRDCYIRSFIVITVKHACEPLHCHFLPFAMLAMALAMLGSYSRL